jgi:TAT (twin-arginine translocation) pathway signal sequence
MKRRDFLKTTIATTALATTAADTFAIPSLNIKQTESKTTERILNAYYFRANMYTLVPKHVREDLQWMADAGTNVVSIAVLEQDLTAAVENISFIQQEAARLGMKLFVVPSRWGGLLAGAPKVPSHFSVVNPQTWLKKKDGSFYTDPNVGVHSSVHYPETVDFFKKSLDKVFSLWNVAGIIWDEPKIYDKKDYSDGAQKNIADIENQSLHNQAFSDFFSKLNKHIKTNHPDKHTSLFIYANQQQDVIDGAAGIEHLDYFGCDGRPWSVEEKGQLEQPGKVLIGPGERFIEAAKKNRKKSLFLIENHNMKAENNAWMDKRLPDIVAMKPDQLIYYYYPRNVDKPEENMAIIKKHLKKYK